ncbi:transmembrane protein, partial [Arabidopsis thaliana]
IISVVVKGVARLASGLIIVLLICFLQHCFSFNGKTRKLQKLVIFFLFKGVPVSAGWLKLRVAERHRNLKNMVEGLLKLPEENELPLQRKGDALTGDAHQEI